MINKFKAGIKSWVKNETARMYATVCVLLMNIFLSLTSDSGEPEVKDKVEWNNPH